MMFWKEGKIMPTCPRCKHCFKTLPEEEQDHNCPKCGWGPEKYEEVIDKCFNCGKQIPEKEAQEMDGYISKCSNTQHNTERRRE